MSNSTLVNTKSMKLNIVENILTKNDCYRKGDTIKPIGMQLHTIGTAQNTSSALASYWNQPGVEACVHYCVDAETERLVRHFLPDNRRSWGDGGFGNGNLITVELMESDCMKYTGGANYTVTNESKFKADVTRAYNTAVYFFAYKCKQYGWNPLEKMSNGLYRISSHDEGRRLGLSTAHVDPTHIWNRYGWTMDQFRRDVKKVMDGGEIDVNTSASSTTITYYRVRKSWADSASQLGAYEVLQNAKDNCPEGYSVFDEKGNAIYTNKATTTTSFTSGTQSSQITGTEKEKAAQMLEIVHKCDKSGILYSVTAAQMILESGYCTTELSKKANNCFGMKCGLSGNKWESVWDGRSKINIRTPEQDRNGNQYYIYAYFRKYPCIEDSIKDHACYLLGAMNGRSKKRYAGLTECEDYKSAITLIKNGGYATDVKYIDKICNIIERFELYVYDSEITKNSSSSAPSQPTTSTTTAKTPYRVATAYTGGKYVGQIGAYEVLSNATKAASDASQKAKKTYYVYDNTGIVVYTAQYSSTTTNTKITKVSEWIKAVKDWEQKMIDVKAVYSNKNNKTDYEVALKQKPVLTNCALFVTHTLQIAGIFSKKDKFYGDKGTTIKGSAASKMGTIGKITTYSKANVTADKANIPVGAIVTWHEGHTNVYLGKNDKGQMTWSDAGRGTNVGCKENSYWKSFRKIGNMSGYHVANVIALNLLDDVSKEDANKEIPTIEGKMYIVQAGAFAVETNAKKQVTALKKKGFDAIAKKRSNDWFVQCGVFKNKKNADDLIVRLKKAGFSAILRF